MHTVASVKEPVLFCFALLGLAWLLTSFSLIQNWTLYSTAFGTVFHLHDYEFCDGIAVKEKISSAHRQRRFNTDLIPCWHLFIF